MFRSFLRSGRRLVVPDPNAPLAYLCFGDYLSQWAAPKNILQVTERMQDTAWWRSDNGTATLYAGGGPAGLGLDAVRLNEDENWNFSAPPQHRIYNYNPDVARKFESLVAPGQSYTYSVYVKPDGRDWMRLYLQDQGFGNFDQWFNVSTGAVGGTQLPAYVTGATAAAIGGGWYRVSAQVAFPAGISQQCFAEFSLGLGDGNYNYYTTDPALGMYFSGPMLTPGTSLLSFAHGRGWEVRDWSGNGLDLQVNTRGMRWTAEGGRFLENGSFTAGYASFGYGSLPLSIGGPWTAIVVVKATGTAGPLFWITDPDANVGSQQVLYNGSGNVQAKSRFGATANTSANLAVPTASWVCLGVRCTSGGNLEVKRMDNSALVTAVNAGPTSTSTDCGVGHSSATTNAPARCDALDVAALKIYRRVLNDTELGNDYTAIKAGLLNRSVTVL